MSDGAVDEDDRPIRQPVLVEAGKLVDLIVVRDNPLDDIDNVQTLAMVFKGGRLVADNR